MRSLRRSRCYHCAESNENVPDAKTLIENRVLGRYEQQLTKSVPDAVEMLGVAQARDGVQARSVRRESPVIVNVWAMTSLALAS